MFVDLSIHNPLLVIISPSEMAQNYQAIVSKLTAIINYPRFKPTEVNHVPQSH